MKTYNLLVLYGLVMCPMIIEAVKNLKQLEQAGARAFAAEWDRKMEAQRLADEELAKWKATPEENRPTIDE